MPHEGISPTPLGLKARKIDSKTNMMITTLPFFVLLSIFQPSKQHPLIIIKLNVTLKWQKVEDWQQCNRHPRITLILQLLSIL